MGREAESVLARSCKEWMGGADFVGRDEFEAVKAMAAAARDENEVLKARIAALEAKVAGPAAARPSARRKRSREREPERRTNPGRARRRRANRGPRAIFRGARLGVRTHGRGRNHRLGHRQLGAVRASRRLAARGPGAAVPGVPRHQGRAREECGDLRGAEPHQRAAVARPFRDVVGVGAGGVPPLDDPRHARPTRD